MDTRKEAAVPYGKTSDSSLDRTWRDAKRVRTGRISVGLSR